MYTDVSLAKKVSKTKSKVPNFGQMKCEIVLCIDSGAANDLRWCPLPSHDVLLVLLLLRICSCLIYFVIPAWWRTATEEVATAWRNFCCSWSIGHGTSLSWSFLSCLWYIQLFYYPRSLYWIDSRIQSFILLVNLPNSILRILLEETSCWAPVLTGQIVNLSP